jgi:HD-like signal output (HDOD) protein
VKFQASSQFTRLRIQQRLEDTLELPLLPETSQRILRLRSDPDAVMGDLVDIVESDPGLAAQIVSWASSSFYASAGQVRSVHDAVSRVLGFDLVMNLAMGLALGRPLRPPLDNPDHYLGYWQQATWQAQSAGILAGMMPRTRRPVFGLAYLAGLLHNFGDMVLVQVFPPYHQQLCQWQSENSHGDRPGQELRLMGYTREEIAARLLENWGMPDEVTLAVRHQNEADYTGPHSGYVRVVWLGRQLLTARGALPGRAEPVPQSVYEELGLGRGTVEKQFDELVRNRDGIMAMAGMMPAAW